MTLCFDFGNTRLKCAIFEGSTLKEVLILDDDHIATIQQLLQTYKPAKTLLSSVINHNMAIEDFLSQHTQFHKLSHLSKLPVTIPVGKAETVGADRLALIVAAINYSPGTHNLVIGLGTCITYNFVNKFHEFLGGSISPGLEMRLKSMHDLTAKLPLVKPHWNFPLVGYDTRTNLLSGVILGMSKEIDGIVELYLEKYDNLNVMITGGDMDFFSPHLKNKMIADKDLMFKGLYAINEFN